MSFGIIGLIQDFLILRQVLGALQTSQGETGHCRPIDRIKGAAGQHIRRDRATSNICTNSGLCALAFTVHMTLLGERGLTRLARLNHAHAVELYDALAKVPGVTVLNDTFFNEFSIRVTGDAAEIVERLAARGVLAGLPVSRLEPDNPALRDLIVVAATELTTGDDRDAFVSALTEVLA